MISYVRGILSDIGEGFVVVEACGIGYMIYVPATVLPGLPPLGDEIKIYTHFSVKEDGQSLYGFLQKEDREMFRQLLGVNGVGPKGALGILSVLRPDELRLAIISGDAKAISRAQGIGLKTAQRVILDLKDKVSMPDLGDVTGGYGDIASYGAFASGSQGAFGEAMEALISLGYSRSEAGTALRKVKNSGIGEDAGAEAILKQALRNF